MYGCIERWKRQQLDCHKNTLCFFAMTLSLVALKVRTKKINPFRHDKLVNLSNTYFTSAVSLAVQT